MCHKKYIYFDDFLASFLRNRAPFRPLNTASQKYYFNYCIKTLLQQVYLIFYWPTSKEHREEKKSHKAAALLKNNKGVFYYMRVEVFPL